MKLRNFFIFLVFTCFIVACKNTKDDKHVEVDFLINDEELESLGFDYDEKALSLYTNDPDKVYFTTVGEDVEFKDITLPIDSKNRKWYLDNDEWKSEKLVYQGKASFIHQFETPGLYRIRLVDENSNTVIKFVRVLENTENTLANYNRANSNSRDIGEFEVFDFKVSNNEPAKWEAIIFEDISQTEEEITKRLWDFGDGTIIPTNGKKVKYSYARSGVYEVKMCVNLTDQCKRKRIVVSEALSEENVIVAQVEKNEKPIGNKSNRNVSKANTSIVEESTSAISSPAEYKNDVTLKSNVPLVLQNVNFDLPEKMQAGLPVRLKDMSFPDDAIQSRSWFIDGVKQYFHQRTVNYIFDTPGTYEVKMCLNKKRDQCVQHKINIYKEVDRSVDLSEKLVVPSKEVDNNTYIPIISKPSKGFLCTSYGKAGIKSKYKCTTNKEYHYGNAIVNIIPNKDMELQNAEIYGERDGYMDVFILDKEFKELGRIINVQILPGYSTIEFADLAFTLECKQKYSILLKPKSVRNDSIGLENASTCNVPMYNSEDLQVEYQGKIMVMYDIKYCL